MRSKVTPLSRAAVAVGADGLIVEVHHDPDRALSDGKQSLYLEQFEELLTQMRQIAPVVHRSLAERGMVAAAPFGPGQRSMTRVWRVAVAAGSLAAIFLLVGCSSDPAVAANYHEYAYVTNGKSDSVSVLDARYFQSIKTISVGHGPTGIAVNPANNEIYVVNTGSDSVSVIDAQTNQVVSTIPVRSTPYFISVSRDGKRGYVANAGSGSVSVLDLAKHAALDTISVGAAPGIAQVSPDGPRWWFPTGSATASPSSMPPRGLCALHWPFVESRRMS